MNLIDNTYFSGKAKLKKKPQFFAFREFDFDICKTKKGNKLFQYYATCFRISVKIIMNIKHKISYWKKQKKNY